MSLIQIISNLTADVLFEWDAAKNSIKATLEAAVTAKTDLRGANLREANLREANLYKADLYDANLRGADFRGADLRGATLCEANLCGANLCGANLCGANLHRAKLYGANLRGADLRGADLHDANLRETDLRGADLYGANLHETDFRGASLRRANLCGANLYEADLHEADLHGADLHEADLRGANLYEAKNAAFVQAQTSIVPETGCFEGHKKLRDGNIATLGIPATAKRSNATGRKCRAEYADVLSIVTMRGEAIAEGVSLYDATLVYRVGERVACNTWDDNRWNECSGGIHFYLTRIEAQQHD